jgi:hypothetical protein
MSCREVERRVGDGGRGRKVGEVEGIWREGKRWREERWREEVEGGGGMEGGEEGVLTNTDWFE